jgi:hypothetical protein
MTQQLKTDKSILYNSWSYVLRSKRLVSSFFISLVALFGIAFTAPSFFIFIQNRKGFTLHDQLLKILPAVDLSGPIFLLLYLLIAIALVYLIMRPALLLIALQAYAILTLCRFITLLAVPLENPERLILLSDPLVDNLLYRNAITKDLFFSGHSSIIFLFGFIVESKLLKWILFIGAIIIATLLLIQHAHYTIDVLAAPLFAFLSYQISNYILKRLCYSEI